MARAKRKRNPTDATLRNVRAAKERTRTLSGRMKKLEQRVRTLEQIIGTTKG